MATMNPSMLAQLPEQAQEPEHQIPPKPSRVSTDKAITKYKRQQAKYTDLLEDQNTLKDELKKAEAKAAKIQAECDLVIDQLLANSASAPRPVPLAQPEALLQPGRPMYSNVTGTMSRSTSQQLAGSSGKRFREDGEQQGSHEMQGAKRIKVGDLLN